MNLYLCVLLPSFKRIDNEHEQWESMGKKSRRGSTAKYSHPHFSRYSHCSGERTPKESWVRNASVPDKDVKVEILTCCLCCEDLPSNHDNFSRLTCCGQGLHDSCWKKFCKSKCSMVCPLCRAQYPQDGSLEYLQNLNFWVNKGKAWAQTSLAAEYGLGSTNLAQSYAKAAELLAMAVAQNYPSAMTALGVMYEEGQGVEQSNDKAAELFHRAAEQGDVCALYNLGNMYSQGGRGVEQSFAKAVELYTLAAEQGEVSAQYNLGKMYSQGIEVEQSYAKSMHFYSMAAEQGSTDGMVNLGSLFVHGQGCAPSNEKAREWWIKAAAQGDEVAIHNLKLLETKEPQAQ